MFPEGDAWRGGLYKCGYHDRLAREYWACEGPDASHLLGQIVRHRRGSAATGAGCGRWRCCRTGG